MEQRATSAGPGSGLRLLRIGIRVRINTVHRFLVVHCVTGTGKFKVNGGSTQSTKRSAPGIRPKQSFGDHQSLLRHTPRQAAEPGAPSAVRALSAAPDTAVSAAPRNTSAPALTVAAEAWQMAKWSEFIK